MRPVGGVSLRGAEPARTGAVAADDWLGFSFPSEVQLQELFCLATRVSAASLHTDSDDDAASAILPVWKGKTVVFHVFFYSPKSDELVQCLCQYSSPLPQPCPVSSSLKQRAKYDDIVGLFNLLKFQCRTLLKLNPACRKSTDITLLCVCVCVCVVQRCWCTSRRAWRGCGTSWSRRRRSWRS